MAMSFDGTERKTFDATGLVMSTSEWVVAIRANLTGTDTASVIIGNNTPDSGLGSANCFNVFLNNVSSYRFYHRGNSGTGVFLTSTAAPGPDGVDRLFVMQRDNTAAEIQLWMCTPGATAVKEASASTTGVVATTETHPAYLGANTNATASLFITGKVGEFWRGDGFVLTQAQIEGLASGYLHPQFLGHDLTFYHPMFEVSDTMIDRRGNYNLTGASIGATAPHFQVFQRDR